MVFYGYHGMSASEKDLGGKFEVDLDLYRSLKKAGQADDIKYTLDYQAIYETVYDCTKNNKFYLVEALAEKIARTIIELYEVDRLIVRVRKPHAPVKGVLDTVEVEVERCKTDYV